MSDIVRNKNKNDWKSMFDFYIKYNETPVSKGVLMGMAYTSTRGVDSAIPQSLWGELDDTFYYVYDYTDKSLGELVDLRQKLKFSNNKVDVTIVVNGDVLYKERLPEELQNVTFHQALKYVFNNDEVEAFDIRPKTKEMALGGFLAGVGVGVAGKWAYDKYGKKSQGKGTKKVASKSNKIKNEEGGSSLKAIAKKFERNEDINAHSENVVLLAKHFGTKEELAEANSILKKHNEEGSLSSENGRKRKALNEKLMKKARVQMSKEGIKFSTGGGVGGGKVYVLSGYSAEAYEDSYEEGELGFAGSWDEKESKTFSTKQELIDYINDKIIYTEYEESHFDWETGDGKNIQTDVLCSYDDYSGYYPADKKEIELWKKGKKKLYNVHYWIYVMAVVPTEYSTGGIIPNQRTDTKFDSYTAVGYAEGFVEAPSMEAEIEAWAYLIATRQAYSLQGWFGRQAENLIANGIIARDGTINWDKVDSMSDEQYAKGGGMKGIAKKLRKIKNDEADFYSIEEQGLPSGRQIVDISKLKRFKVTYIPKFDINSVMSFGEKVVIAETKEDAIRQIMSKNKSAKILEVKTILADGGSLGKNFKLQDLFKKGIVIRNKEGKEIGWTNWQYTIGGL